MSKNVIIVLIVGAVALLVYAFTRPARPAVPKVSRDSQILRMYGIDAIAGLTRDIVGALTKRDVGAPAGDGYRYADESDRLYFAEQDALFK